MIYDRQGNTVDQVDRLPVGDDLLLRASVVKDVIEVEDERLFDARFKAIRAEFGEVDEVVTPAPARRQGPSVTWGEWIVLACCLLLVLNMVLMVLSGKVF